jgi:hypothetical protein
VENARIGNKRAFRYAQSHRGIIGALQSDVNEFAISGFAEHIHAHLFHFGKLYIAPMLNGYARELLSD